MTAPLYTVVAYTSRTDVEPGFWMVSEQEATRLFVTLAHVSPFPVALYRHDGPVATCMLRNDPRVEAVAS